MATAGTQVIYRVREEMSCFSMDNPEERVVYLYITGPSGREQYAGRTIRNTRTGENRLPEVGE